MGRVYRQRKVSGTLREREGERGRHQTILIPRPFAAVQHWWDHLFPCAPAFDVGSQLDFVQSTQTGCVCKTRLPLLTSGVLQQIIVAASVISYKYRQSSRVQHMSTCVLPVVGYTWYWNHPCRRIDSRTRMSFTLILSNSIARPAAQESSGKGVHQVAVILCENSTQTVPCQGQSIGAHVQLYTKSTLSALTTCVKCQAQDVGETRTYIYPRCDTS